MKIQSRREKILLCALLMNLQSQMQLQLVIITNLIKKKHLSYIHSDIAKNHRRNPDHRLEFSDLVGRTHKRAFRLMFRMNNSCFNAVCSKIESNIGREKFKSEAYLSELEEAYTDNKKFNMFTANKKTTGGYLSGEIRVAIALRVLAGG